MHRDARHYPDPERFDPDRWTPEFKAALPRFAYFPFGGGPRQCIGESFAWMELMLIVGTLAQRWTLRLEPGTQTGMAYRLRAKGLPRLGEGGHGDMHVRIHVWTPTKLTAEQRKLLEKLSEVEDAPPEKESGKFWDTIRRALGQL